MGADVDSVPAGSRFQAGKPLSAGEIWEGAKALRPFLASKSEEIERARRLTPEVVAAMHDKGLFRLNMPRIWGGPEMTSMEQVEVIEEISRGDASAGWCLMIGCDSGLYSGYLEDGVARRLYPRLDMVQAGWVYPVGQAHETDDGYLVKKSQWAFCSGSTHADRIAAGCTVFGSDGEPKRMPNGQPEWRIVIAPAEDWEIQDTWYTTGLRGTASNDYTIPGEGMFVPREHTFTWFVLDGEHRREGVLWAKPDTLLRKMPGIPLGLARGEALTEKERADVWVARLNAFQTARDVVGIIYDTVGGSAIYAHKGPLDRALRDTTTMCQHVVGQLKSLEPVGALLLQDEGGSKHPML